MSPNTVLRRIVPVALAAAIIATPAAVFADESVSIDINPGNVPTTAEGHADGSCDQVPDDIAPDQDGWVFVLPSDAGDKGEFISVTAAYTDLDGAVHTYDTEANGGIAESASGNAASKAYMLTPAGWTLTAATADVSGVTADARFNLTHTCAGSPGDTPGDGPTASDSASDSAGDEASGEDDEILPVTGSGLGLPLLAGVALVTLGALALLLANRRRAALSGRGGA